MQDLHFNNLKWRLPTLRKNAVRFNDLLELKSEMQRTREQNYEHDDDYQDYYTIGDDYSLSRFPDYLKNTMTNNSRAGSRKNSEMFTQADELARRRSSIPKTPLTKNLKLSFHANQSLQQQQQQNQSDILLRRKWSTSENLVRQRTIHTSNPALYLEYINILGSPNIVEKYLSETVRLKPVEKKPREKQRRSGDDGSNNGDHLIRLHVSYTNTKINQYVTTMSTNLKNQTSNIKLESAKTDAKTITTTLTGPSETTSRIKTSSLNDQTTTTTTMTTSSSSSRRHQQLNSSRRPVRKPYKKRVPKISKSSAKNSWSEVRKERSSMWDELNGDEESMYKQIAETELSLSSSSSDADDLLVSQSIAEDNFSSSSSTMTREETATRPRGARFERRALSVIDDTETSSSSNLRSVSIKKRTKMHQRSFLDSPTAKEPDDAAIDHLVDEQVIPDVESSNRDSNEADDFDPKFVYRFGHDFLLTKKNPEKRFEMMRHVEESNQEQKPRQLEQTVPQQPPLAPPTRTRIDFNMFKFFRKKFRTPLLRNEKCEDSDELVGGVELGDDWLLKWCIFDESKQKQCERVFRHHDWSAQGYLIGPQLLAAIEAISKLDNLKMNYLFSVLKLCDADPLARGAGLKLFTVICALAHRIEHLDDDWFHNMLPALDLFTVENKMFKIKNLWSILVDPATKTIDMDDLMIEFCAGGVTPNHVAFARRKFNEKTHFDLLDYLKYIPLFVFIHDRIVANPLDEKQDL